MGEGQQCLLDARASRITNTRSTRSSNSHQYSKKLTLPDPVVPRAPDAANAQSPTATMEQTPEEKAKKAKKAAKAAARGQKLKAATPP